MGRDGHDTSTDDGDGPLPPDGAARIGRWMFVVLFWGVLIVGIGLVVDDRLTERAEARAPRALGADGGPPGIELVADRRGHYVVVGEVNGRALEFLVDTGASDVAIPAALSDELGLVPGRALSVQTANGRARARATTIGQLAVGPLRRRNVPATLVPGMSGRTALLGMSFLRHHDLEQRGGRLVIRAPTPH